MASEQSMKKARELKMGFDPVTRVNYTDEQWLERIVKALDEAAAKEGLRQLRYSTPKIRNDALEEATTVAALYDNDYIKVEIRVAARRIIRDIRALKETPHGVR